MSPPAGTRFDRYGFELASVLSDAKARPAAPLSASRKPTRRGPVGLRVRGWHQPEISRFQNRLHAGFDAEALADSSKVTLDGAARDAKDAADVVGALALLNPRKTFQLSSSNAKDGQQYVYPVYADGRFTINILGLETVRLDRFHRSISLTLTLRSRG